jgi:peptidyl-prolyl cis-trans isomerase-like 2
VAEHEQSVMVKRQREKQYQSARENRAFSHIRSGTSAASSSGTIQRRLPFSHCALSLTPYESPVCNREGIVFENSTLLPFVMTHKTDPVSGQPMTTLDVITLNMDQDQEGRWQCPVLTKPFADHTKIVAILQPGGNDANVYSFEAYQELNVKAKNYEDLISGTKFNKKTDVLVLNDPDDEDLNQRRDINRFYHVLHARELEQKKKTSGVASDVRYSLTATRVMEQLKKNKAEQEEKATDRELIAKKQSEEDESPELQLTSLVVDGKSVKILATDVTGVKLTSGKVASSFTSTSEDVAHDNVEREATREEVLLAQFRVMRKLKKKGLVLMRTTIGDLTLELHCDIVPRTCTNFLGLCRAGKYNDTTFHRLIKSFMIQGGKANDGTLDESFWGGAFEDEFDDRLKHTGGGILSMANAGANTNNRQFFVTFKSCGHLDRKHSVFGRVVGGTDVLRELDLIQTDGKDRPKVVIKIVATEILEDPCRLSREVEVERISKLIRARFGRSDVKGTNQFADVTAASSKQEVGRYLKDRLKESSAISDEMKPSRLPPPPKTSNFGDMAGW